VKGDFGHIYQDIDILLVPLDNNRFNRCKSELKFIEAGFSQTAVIASNVIPYSNFGSNGKDCLLVKENTPEEWAKVVKRLIRDRDTIDRLAKANSERVMLDRDIEIVGDRRADFIRKIMEAK
jgi:glycosyltransferase involved in cell wall biosynthesis